MIQQILTSSAFVETVVSLLVVLLSAAIAWVSARVASKAKTQEQRELILATAEAARTAVLAVAQTTRKEMAAASGDGHLSLSEANRLKEEAFLTARGLLGGTFKKLGPQAVDLVKAHIESELLKAKPAPQVPASLPPEAA